MSTDTMTHESLSTLVRNARRAQNGGNLAEAYANYTRATDLEPNDLVSWLGRSETAADPFEVLVSLGYAVALDPSNPLLRQRLQQTMDERMAQAHPVQATQMGEVGREFALVGLRDEAVRLLVRATELDPDLAEAWLWRAGLEADPARSSEYIRHAAEVDPNNANAQAALMWITSQPTVEGAEIPAVPSFAPAPTASAAANNGSSVDQLIAQGERFMQADDKAHALPFFVEATELDPHSEHAWLWRASATDNVDEALASLEQALTINPDNPQAREARTVLRVRKLRESVKTRGEATASSTTGRTTASKQAGVARQKPMFSAPTLVLIVVLILILLAAGAFVAFQLLSS